MRQILTAICENDKIAESEFLLRELGIKLKKIHPKKVRPQNKNIIVSNQPKIWESFLFEAKPKSTIFILIGNETYNPEIYLKLNSIPAINIVLMHNPPRKNRIIGLSSVLGFILDSPSSLFNHKFYRTCKNSIDFAIKTRRVMNEINYKFLELPYGYSNRFIIELKRLKLINKSDGKSLLKYNFPTIKELNSEGISFTGSINSWVRQRLIRKAQKKHRFSIYIMKSWGQPVNKNQTIYVESILDSVGVLHLPGHVTNCRSYRYFETILLNRIPICPPFNVQDHHYSKFWTEIISNNLIKWSYFKLASMVLEMNLEELQKIINKNKLEFKMEIATIIQTIK